MGQDVNRSSWIEASYSAVTWCYKTETWFSFAPPCVELYTGCVYMLEQTSGVSSTQQNRGRKFIPVYVCEQFLRYSRRTCWHESFRLWTVGTRKKNPSVFLPNLKWRDTSPTNFLCLSNHSQAPGISESVQQFVISCVRACIDSGGERFENFW